MTLYEHLLNREIARLEDVWSHLSYTPQPLMDLYVERAALRQQEEVVRQKDAEIERLKPDAEWARYGRQRIAELEAENDKLATISDHFDQMAAENDTLKARLRQQQEECERFHKPS